MIYSRTASVENPGSIRIVGGRLIVTEGCSTFVLVEFKAPERARGEFENIRAAMVRGCDYTINETEE